MEENVGAQSLSFLKESLIEIVLIAFLWTGTEMKATGAKVSWFSLYEPNKCEGGLGDWNKAAIMKHLSLMGSE